MTTDDSDPWSWSSFRLGVIVAVFVFIVATISFNLKPANSVCESVSKGAVWDNELKLCVHIDKEAVSDERIEP